jgi:hypothetical protein
VELLYRWQCQQYRDDIDENKIISIEKMANPHQMHSPLLGSDASVARPPLLLWMWLLWPLLLSLPVPGESRCHLWHGRRCCGRRWSDALCGTAAAAWFHVVEYAC